MDINAPCKGQTALPLAADQLAQRGGGDGQVDTPLLLLPYYCLEDPVPMYRLLADHGAEIAARIVEDKSALHLACNPAQAPGDTGNPPGGSRRMAGCPCHPSVVPGLSILTLVVLSRPLLTYFTNPYVGEVHAGVRLVLAALWVAPSPMGWPRPRLGQTWATRTLGAYLRIGLLGTGSGALVPLLRGWRKSQLPLSVLLLELAATLSGPLTS